MALIHLRTADSGVVKNLLRRHALDSFFRIDFPMNFTIALTSFVA